MKGIRFVFLKIIYYFCLVNEFSIDIYTKSEDLPFLLEGNFFHSRELFSIMEHTPGHSPYMVVATSKDGYPIGQLLVTVQRRGNWIPPYLYTHARAHGEGEYAENVDAGSIFGEMLKAITHKLDRRLCLYIEFSDIKKKMFGYREFRQNDYFPITWQEIHNSLHSLAPIERLSPKMAERIEKLERKGIETHEVTQTSEIVAFHKLLKRFYRFKPRRHIPSIQHFEQMSKSQNAKIFLTTYKQHIIAGCACVYSQHNAYLWYLAAKRKTFVTLHPDTMAVWHAIQYAYEHKYDHIYFMDVGLPWHKNPFREFILSFGGKPVSKFRWFRFYNHFVNIILKWLYKTK